MSNLTLWHEGEVSNMESVHTHIQPLLFRYTSHYANLFNAWPDAKSEKIQLNLPTNLHRPQHKTQVCLGFILVALTVLPVISHARMYIQTHIHISDFNLVGAQSWLPQSWIIHQSEHDGFFWVWFKFFCVCWAFSSSVITLTNTTLSHSHF